MDLKSITVTEYNVTYKITGHCKCHATIFFRERHTPTQALINPCNRTPSSVRCTDFISAFRPSPLARLPLITRSSKLIQRKKGIATATEEFFMQGCALTHSMTSTVAHTTSGVSAIAAFTAQRATKTIFLRLLSAFIAMLRYFTL